MIIMHIILRKRVVYDIFDWYVDSRSVKGIIKWIVYAQEFINIISRPWLLTPGFLIFVAVLSFNVIGDTIRDIVDPKSKVR